MSPNFATVHVREIGRPDSYCRLQIGATSRFFERSDKNSPTVLKGHRYGFTSALDFQPILRYASAARASAPFFDLSTQEFVAIETGTFANDARS